MYFSGGMYKPSRPLEMKNTLTQSRHFGSGARPLGLAGAPVCWQVHRDCPPPPSPPTQTTPTSPPPHAWLSKASVPMQAPYSSPLWGHSKHGGRHKTYHFSCSWLLPLLTWWVTAAACSSSSVWSSSFLVTYFRLILTSSPASSFSPLCARPWSHKSTCTGHYSASWPPAPCLLVPTPPHLTIPCPCSCP